MTAKNRGGGSVALTDEPVICAGKRKYRWVCELRSIRELVI